MNSPNSNFNYVGMMPYHYVDTYPVESHSLDANSFCTMYGDINPKAYHVQPNFYPQVNCGPFYPQVQHSFMDDNQQYQYLQELRRHGALQDLRNGSSFNSSSGRETIGAVSAGNTPITPIMNGSFTSVNETIPTPEFLPVLDSAQSHKNFDENTSPMVPKPAPKKHTRKHIMARSRSGCWICRIKHLKCDELKPTCKNCNRFGIQCDYSEDRPDYVSNRELRRQKLDSITKKKRRTRPVQKLE